MKQKKQSNSIVFWVLGIAAIGIAAWFVYTRFVASSGGGNTDPEKPAHTIFDASTGKPITDAEQIKAFTENMQAVRGNVTPK